MHEMDVASRRRVQRRKEGKCGLCEGRPAPGSCQMARINNWTHTRLLQPLSLSEGRNGGPGVGPDGSRKLLIGRLL